MDTENFVFNVKTEDIYKDIVENVEERLDTFEMDRLFSKEKNKNVIGPMKITKVDKSWKICGITTKTLKLF